jgi:serine/threonine protein kinase
MSAKPKDEAFQRHPRPQLPTKAALLFESRKNTEKLKIPSPNGQAKTRVLRHGSPWATINRLGNLVQGEHQWLVGLSKGKMTMLRKSELEVGRQLLEKMKLLAHPSISKLEDVFEDKSSLYFCFEYSRFTLEEILNVHLRLDESHIQMIACSVRLTRTAILMWLMNVGLLCNQAHSYSWHSSQRHLPCDY